MENIRLFPRLNKLLAAAFALAVCANFGRAAQVDVSPAAPMEIPVQPASSLIGGPGPQPQIALPAGFARNLALQMSAIAPGPAAAAPVLAAQLRGALLAQGAPNNQSVAAQNLLAQSLTDPAVLAAVQKGLLQTATPESQAAAQKLADLAAAQGPESRAELSRYAEELKKVLADSLGGDQNAFSRFFDDSRENGTAELGSGEPVTPGDGAARGASRKIVLSLAPSANARPQAERAVPAPGQAAANSRSMISSPANSAPTTALPNTAEELVEMFGNSKSAAKNLNPTIITALAARYDLSEEEMKRRIGNIIKMYPLLEAQKAANTALRSLFLEDNKEHPEYQAQLSRVQHEAWLANEKTRPSYVQYTRQLHDLLRRAVKTGAVLVPTAPIKDRLPLSPADFENPKKKFKFQAKHFVFDDAGQKEAFARDFLAVTGRKFEGDAWEINTIAGEWDDLSALTVEPERQAAWDDGRGKFLNGLQEDNVSGGLAAIHSRKIIDELNSARTSGDFMNAVVDMSRIVNVGWRLNNPWFGFGYKLQYRPFHPDPNIGIGIEEIRKDTITLKATLELLRDNKGIVLPKEVRNALDGAFARGLDRALEEAVAPGGQALSAAILKQSQKPVILAADQSNVLEYLSWIFSSQELIDRHMSGEALQVLAQAWDKKGRAETVRNIENALAMLEVLHYTQDANDAAHTALAPKVPAKVRARLARLGHESWLAQERMSLGKRFVAYSPALHELVLEFAGKGVLAYNGRALTRADIAGPRGRFRLTAANFRRSTAADRAAFAEFEERFERLTGEPFSDADAEPLVEINTFAAPWTTLTGLAPDGLNKAQKKKWAAERAAALYGFRAHSFTPVLAALFDEKLMEDLGSASPTLRQDALLRIIRRSDTNTRLDDADRGFDRITLSYDVTAEGGVGVDRILQDVQELIATLRTIVANVDSLDFPASVRAKIKEIATTKLLASARSLSDRDALVKVIERNRVKENFTLDAAPAPNLIRAGETIIGTQEYLERPPSTYFDRVTAVAKGGGVTVQKNGNSRWLSMKDFQKKYVSSIPPEIIRSGRYDRVNPKAGAAYVHVKVLADVSGKDRGLRISDGPGSRWISMEEFVMNYVPRPADFFGR